MHFWAYTWATSFHNNATSMKMTECTVLDQQVSGEHRYRLHTRGYVFGCNFVIVFMVYPLEKEHGWYYIVRFYAFLWFSVFGVVSFLTCTNTMCVYAL
jgi:hypothetical protein